MRALSHYSHLLITFSPRKYLHSGWFLIKIICTFVGFFFPKCSYVLESTRGYYVSARWPQPISCT